MDEAETFHHAFPQALSLLKEDDLPVEECGIGLVRLVMREVGRVLTEHEKPPTTTSRDSAPSIWISGDSNHQKDALGAPSLNWREIAERGCRDQEGEEGDFEAGGDSRPSAEEENRQQDS